MNVKLLSSLALTAALASTAAADTRSWTVLKSKLPAGTIAAISIDVAAIKKGTKSFSAVVQEFVDKEKDAKMALTMVKTTCGLDPFDAISDVSIALDAHGDGVVAVGLAGVDEAKLVACAGKMIASMDAKAKLTVKAGKVSEYVIAGQTSMYASWAAKDVVVFSTNPEKRDLIDAAMKGTAATGDLASYLGKAGTAGVFMIAGLINDDGIKGGFGSITLDKGTFKGAGKLVAESAAVASKMLKEGQGELAQAVGKAEKKAPVAAKFLKAIKLSGAGTEINVDGSLNEADLKGLLTALDKVF
ncbi:MAG: hypothetical protein NT062_29770 [Proteobacteria bacterium]|nr:hypothetical protein [Pseudomonadota bacterium]